MCMYPILRAHIFSPFNICWLAVAATRAQNLLRLSAQRSDLATMISEALQWHLRRFGRRELITLAGVPAFSK
jgi:hypothetical protein